MLQKGKLSIRADESNRKWKTRFETGSKKKAKKRKAFASTTRSKQTKKRRTTSVRKDIFG